MGRIGYLLTLPLLGGVRLVRSLAGAIDEESQHQLLNEDAIRGELLELQEWLEADVIAEEDYEQLEATLLERLDAARALRAQRSLIRPVSD